MKALRLVVWIATAAFGIVVVGASAWPTESSPSLADAVAKTRAARGIRVIYIRQGRVEGVYQIDARGNELDQASTRFPGEDVHITLMTIGDSVFTRDGSASSWCRHRSAGSRQVGNLGLLLVVIERSEVLARRERRATVGYELMLPRLLPDEPRRRATVHVRSNRIVRVSGLPGRATFEYGDVPPVTRPPAGSVLHVHEGTGPCGSRIEIAPPATTIAS